MGDPFPPPSAPAETQPVEPPSAAAGPPSAASGGNARPLAILVVVATWLAVGISCLMQKVQGDQLLADESPSAVQIQQINGQVTAHVAVALVIGLGVTCVVWTAALFRSSD